MVDGLRSGGSAGQETRATAGQEAGATRRRYFRFEST